MKTAQSRISHRAVAADFAQTLWLAAAAGLGFSLLIAAVVVLVASVA